MIKTEQVNWVSFENFLQGRDVKPKTLQDLLSLKKIFGQKCIREIAHKSESSSWDKVKAELRNAEALPATRLNHLSYLVHLDQAGLDKFHKIKELCLLRKYDEMESYFPSFSPQFFLQVFLQILDPVIQLEIIGKLYEKIQFKPYLDAIHKEQAVIMPELLKEGISETNRISNPNLREFRVRELYSTLCNPSSLRKLCLEIRANGAGADVIKIKEELEGLPLTSILRKYLIDQGVIDQNGALLEGITDIDTRERVVSSLKFLAFHLKVDEKEIEALGSDKDQRTEMEKLSDLSSERYNLTIWDEAIPKILYARFLKSLEPVYNSFQYDSCLKVLIEIRDSKKNSVADKVRKSAARLKSVNNQPSVRQLKEALTITVKGKELEEFFSSGPLSSLDLGLTWNPSISSQKQWEAKEDLEFLYLKTVVSLAREKGIALSEYDLYQSYDRGEYCILLEIARKLPTDLLKARLENQINSFYKDSIGEIPSSFSPYEVFLAFKQYSKDIYIEVRDILTNPLHQILAEEAYINHNITTLLHVKNLETQKLVAQETVSIKAGEEIESLEGLSSLFQETVVDDPSPYLFKKIDQFHKWMGQEANGLILRRFMIENGLTNIGSEKSALKCIQSAQQVFIALLQKEARILQKPFPERITSVDHLEEIAQSLAYAKFLKLVQFLENTYKKNEKAFLCLGSLKILDESNFIPTSEKRSFSLKILKKLDCPLESGHQNKLINALESPFAKPMNRRSSEVNTDAFKGEVRTECLNWLLTSSFISSLKKTSEKDNLDFTFQSALLHFKNKIEDEIRRLKMPGIYLHFLENAIEKGDQSTLDSIWHEVAYCRYITLIQSLSSSSEDSILKSLNEKHSSLEGLSIFEKVRETKEFLKGLKDLNLTNRLLFELEKLPFDLEEEFLLNQRDLMNEVLLYIEKNKDKPFYRFLEKNGFSPLFFNEETFKWVLSLFRDFINKRIKSVKSSRYQGIGGELLIEELKHLKPLEFGKLDQISIIIKNQEDMDLHSCANLGFNYGVVKKLSDALVTNLPAKIYSITTAVFDLIPDPIVQQNLLKHLVENGFIKCVQFIVKFGNEKSKFAAFEYLKSQMEKPGMTEDIIIPFVMECFLDYELERIKNSLETRGKAKDFIEALEKWMSCEGFYSSIRLILTREGILGKDGKIVPLFSYQHTANTLKNTLFMVSDIYNQTQANLGKSTIASDFEMDPENFNAFDGRFISRAYQIFLDNLPEGTEVKKQCEDLYYNENCSWFETAYRTEGFLSKSSEPGIRTSLLEDTVNELTSSSPAQLESLIYGSIRKVPVSGYTWYLNSVGVRYIEGLSATKNYEYYTTWECEILEHLFQKAQKLKDHSGFLAYPNVFNAFNQTLDTFRKAKNWVEANALVDMLTYTEYQIALNNLPASFKRKSAVKKLINSQMKPQNRLPHQMIEEAKENLPRLDLSEEHQKMLENILERRDFLEKHTTNVERDWKILTESPFKGLPCFQKPFSELSMYRAHLVLDQFYTSLGDSLKENLKGLNVNPFYLPFIEKAHYGQSLPFWLWLCREISYEKYRQTLCRKKTEGMDVSKLLELDLKLGPLGTVEKIKKSLEILQENSHENKELISILKLKTINDLITVV